MANAEDVKLINHEDVRCRVKAVSLVSLVCFVIKQKKLKKQYKPEKR